MDRSARRRIRSAVTTLSALTVASGAVGIAHASAPDFHVDSTTPNRVLSTVVSGTSRHALPDATQLYYKVPGTKVSYLRTDQFTGRKRDVITWEKATEQGSGKRSVDQVSLYEQRRQYSAQTATVKDHPGPGLGIQSAPTRVRQAIAAGTAVKDGVTKADGLTTQILRLKPKTSNTIRDYLYINPRTDAAVMEMRSERVGTRTLLVTSVWLKGSKGRLTNLERKPTIPSGSTKIQ